MEKDIYRKIEDIPVKYRPLIERMVQKGIIGYCEEFEFEITMKEIQIFVILDRLNVIRG